MSNNIYSAKEIIQGKFVSLNILFKETHLKQV